MNKAKTIYVLLPVTLFLLVVLSACGGQEPEDTPQATVVPPTAITVEEIATDEVVEAPAAEETTRAAPTEAVTEEATGPGGTEEGQEAEAPTPQGSGLTAEIVSGDFAGAGKPFTFDGTQSQAGDYPVESYEWDMGDGAFYFGLAVQHAYDEPGEYTVTLTIIDENGERSATSKVVEIVLLEDLLTPTAVSDDPTLALIGTHWLMNNPMRGTIITLNFDEDVLSGSSGCNSYSAGYSVAAADGLEATITVGIISATSQSCTREIMAQEQGFLDSLASAESFRFDDDTLILETSSGTLTFRPAE